MATSDLLQEYLYYERYVNECDLNATRLTGFDRQYQFNSETPSFELICHKVPRDPVVLIVNEPSEEVRRDFLLDGAVRFCLHPQFRDHPCMSDLLSYEALPGIEVSPTASQRTVLAKGKRYAVKLHSPVKILNYYRTMGLRTIRHSLAVSRALEEINHPKFAILPETVGAVFPKRDGKRSWGFLVREMTPRPYVEGSEKRLLIPCFALFQRFKEEPQRRPLLMDLIERSSKSPVDFVLEEIILPVIEYWIYALVNFGLIIEPHGQNCLLEVEPDLSKIHRIVIRDFDIYIHDQTRRKNGQSLEEFEPTNFVNRENPFPFGAEVSLMYDISMTKSLFNPIAEKMRIHYGIDPATLQERARSFILEHLPNHKEYFPEVAYMVSKVDNGVNKHTVLVDPRGPGWRP